MEVNPFKKDGVKLIVGLGNPGSAYHGTRHNIGSRTVELLAKKNKLVFKNNRSFKSFYVKGSIGGQPVILALPQTFMNLSGVAVASLVKKKNIPLKDILVVCDDVALSLGQIRCRPQGSSGGHNGVASCIERLGTNEFARLRLGVGREGEKKDLADYVLSLFKKEEKPDVEVMLKRAVEALEIWVFEGIEECMNRYNTKNKQG